MKTTIARILVLAGLLAVSTLSVNAQAQQPTKWGFHQLGEAEWQLDGLHFLGHFHGEHCPWIYSYNLGTWIYVAALDAGGGTPRDESESIRGESGTWALVLNTGDGTYTEEGDNMHIPNYGGWIYTGYHSDESPWIYFWDLGTWAYVAEGDEFSPMAWAYILNASPQ